MLSRAATLQPKLAWPAVSAALWQLQFRRNPAPKVLQALLAAPTCLCRSTEALASPPLPLGPLRESGSSLASMQRELCAYECIREACCLSG